MANYKYDAFICYDLDLMEDCCLARNTVCKNIKNARFFTHDDILVGENEFNTTENVLFDDCAAVIFILSEDSLKRPQTLHYFEIAQTRHSQDSLFQFIIISFEIDLDIRVKNFIKVGKFCGVVHEIRMHDPLLTSKIKLILNL